MYKVQNNLPQTANSFAQPSNLPVAPGNLEEGQSTGRQTALTAQGNNSSVKPNSARGASNALLNRFGIGEVLDVIA